MLGVGKKRKSTVTPSQSKKKSRRIPTWMHTFVCISDTEQDFVPDCDGRAKLLLAGLGEKRIQLYLDGDAEDIRYELYSHFPKLEEGGGFELLRAQEGGGKLLNVIPFPQTGYSVSYLKTVVHSAKVYIRPLQKNLSLEPTNDEVGSVQIY